MSDVAALNKIIGTAKVGQSSMWLDDETALGMTPNQACCAWENILAGAEVADTPIVAAILAWVTPYITTIKGHVAVASRINAWVRPLLDNACFDKALRRMDAATDEGLPPIGAIDHHHILEEHGAAYDMATNNFDMDGIRFMIMAIDDSGDRMFFVLLTDVEGRDGIIGMVPQDIGRDDDAETPEPVAPVPFEMA